MANGNGSLGSDMIKEIPAWLKLTLQLGAPTVAAGWLIYVITMTVAGDVKELKAAMLQHVATSSVSMQQLSDQRAEANLKLDVLIRVMQTQCVNAATDALQRRDCLNAGGVR